MAYGPPLRFDLDRFKRAVRPQNFVREDADSITFEIPYSEFEAFYEKVKPVFIDWEACGRRKLIREAERYGETMHEVRE